MYGSGKGAKLDEYLKIQTSSIMVPACFSFKISLGMVGFVTFDIT